MFHRPPALPATAQPLTGYRYRLALGQMSLLLIERLFAWQERARQRYALRSMDDRMLRDIGLSRADVEAECVKPFWRP